MLNHWMTHLKGYVFVELTGVYTERLLNACLHNGLAIWSVRKMGEDRIGFHIALGDIVMLKRLRKQYECKLYFKRRYGIPFLLMKMKKRSGFTLGLLSFFVLMLVCSQMVWGIQVKGGSPKIANEVQQAATELGIKRGTFQAQLPPVEKIQQEIQQRVTDATWIGVRQKGTIYEFEIVEHQLPEEAELLSPRHLVASKKAVIYKMFVEHGHPEVKVNDYVMPGDLLVSGTIGTKEDRMQTVPAKGQVLGEIWYTSKVSVPLEASFTTLTGKHSSRYSLTYNDWRLPIWGFGKPDYPEVQEFEKEKSLDLFGWEFPISLTHKEIHETYSFNRTYTEEEAKQVGMEQAEHELREQLPDDAEILSGKLLHEAVDNGKVNLSIHYQVIEDIAKEKPIIQGD
ncbi:sporulation protein YqfD [Alkalihalobacillus sp. FSL W8-0930]